MAHLFLTVRGRYAGEDVQQDGIRLDAGWDGGELGLFEDLASFWAAVAAAEAHDWIVSVHWPLVRKGAGEHLRLLDRDRDLRRQAAEAAVRALEQAKAAGARDVVFHFPYPPLAEGDPARWPGPAGWLEPDAYSRKSLADAARQALEPLAEVRERLGTGVLLEIEGPARWFYLDGLWQELLQEFGVLGLCLDTARLGRLGRLYGRPPRELAEPLLPWVQAVHLHEGRASGEEPAAGVPARPALSSEDGWAGAAAVAEAAVRYNKRVRLVLQHRPALATPEEAEESLGWVRKLAKGRETA